ncbi:MAG TPA: hydrogen peroxide-dependent heme synthase [Gemmatimonadaceae bacterium]|nr:hydrogen peroxide-dependent heme synthase [Gemmatimonadaceae bacterium]
MTTPALAPETLEGWYVLHQTFRLDRAALRPLLPVDFDAIADDFVHTMDALAGGDGANGWSALVPLVGSRADVMVMHFRPTLDALGDAQARLAQARLSDYLTPVEFFLSVTEAGLYYVTAQLAKAAAARKGRVGDDEYQAELKKRVDAELATEHVRKRLYPPLPGGEMPYVCVYPMNKKRETGQNWYALPIEERSELMKWHGLTGRKYAGRVLQIISGSIGLDLWEWAVTLFAADPLEFKKIVSEMRFDEASAKYGEFGNFYVGRIAPPDAWTRGLRPAAR